MEELWKYILTEVMQLEPSVLGVLYIDSPLNNKDYKSKIAQVFFEGLKVNSLIFMNSSTLSLFSTGHTTGFVAEIGHGSTTTIPIFEGFPLAHASQSSFIAGNEITKKWEEELKEKKVEIAFENPMAEREIIKKIKERMSLVALDYERTMSRPDNQTIQERSFELPDGGILEFPIGSRITPPEILFQPKLIGSDAMSLTDMMLYSLQLCDVELQHELANHFVLCGGGSLLNGLLPRIEKEVRLSHARANFNFILGTQRRYSAWIGGSMLGSLSAFQELAISKKEYDDNQL